MDITQSPKPKLPHLTPYITDKLQDPYYSNPRPASTAYRRSSITSPSKTRTRSKSRSKSKSNSHPSQTTSQSESKPHHRRPASTPLGYNPFARFRHDDPVDYIPYQSMTDPKARQRIVDFSQTWDCGEYTIPAMRDEEEERRLKEEEERRFRRRGRGFEEQERGKGKGKGKQVVRDEDEDYEVEGGEMEDVDMLDVV